MSRSLRRHQQAVARLRKIRILHYHWRKPVRTWRQIGRLVMNEPGAWVHEWMTVPARIREHRLAHAVARGLDPDAVTWPDNRKPHKYYW